MSGFIYIWRDRKHNRYYIGSHWGTENDGYICSSYWMRDAYKRRPTDFKRRIIKKIHDRKIILIEEEKYLQMIKDEELGKRYYNLRKTTGHWSTNITPTLKEKLKQAGIKRRGWKHSQKNLKLFGEASLLRWKNQTFREKTIEKMNDPIIQEKRSKKLKGRPTYFTQFKGVGFPEWMKEKRNKSRWGQTNRAKNWIVIHPDGQKEVINNLTTFCQKYNLNRGNMAHRLHSKKFQCQPLEGNI